MILILLPGIQQCSISRQQISEICLEVKVTTNLEANSIAVQLAAFHY